MAGAMRYPVCFSFLADREGNYQDNTWHLPIRTLEAAEYQCDEGLAAE